MRDLEHVPVEVSCGTCKETYTVPASLVAESQRIAETHECSGTGVYECAPAFYASLLTPEQLVKLAEDEEEKK